MPINIDVQKTDDTITMTVDGQCSFSLPPKEFSALLRELERFTTAGANAQSYSFESGGVDSNIEDDTFDSVPDNAMMGVPQTIRNLTKADQFQEWEQTVEYWGILLAQEKNKRGIK